MSIKVMLAEDHAIMREGLRRLLKDHPDIDVVGEAEDGRSAIDLAIQLQPDVIIMDVTMPHTNGIEATRKILERHPNIEVVALSAFDSIEFVEGMIKAGAKAYLLKDYLFEDLLVAIHAVSKGESFFCAKIATIAETISMQNSHND